MWSGGNDFNKLPMHPGDTIVVPEKTFKEPTALRSLLDWLAAVFAACAGCSGCERDQIA